MPAMSKRSPRSELPRWRITRIRSTPAVEIGTVETPDAASAIDCWGHRRRHEADGLHSGAARRTRRA
jgi:hypothetical protein